MSGSILSVNVSTKKGEAKRPVSGGEGVAVREDWGLEGDVHAGPGPKQVSLLAWESVEAQLELMREKGVKCPKADELTEKAGETPSEEKDPYALHPGDYAENLTVQGVDLKNVTPGDRIEVGPDVILEVTRIGKECHRHCAVYQRLGDCVMPREGVFTRVIRGGAVKAGYAVVLRGAES